ncbi:MAG TPA: MFS transporter [Sphingomonas sp.]|nr:MFS transporter [Sphingomonas sp.]
MLKHPNWTLATCILASSLAFIDGSVVNVALPAIGRSLHGDAAGLQWTVNAYTLPLSALLLMGGAAGDHFGRRRLLIGGIVLFTLASVVCALAPDLDMLLAARAIQGIGAAILLPNSLAILGDAFSGEARGRAIGTWAAASAIAGAIGPSFGGWMIGSIGWRPIFLLNVPIAAVAIAIALAAVKESGDGQQPLDWPGAALATGALFALTWALTLWSSTHAMGAQSWMGLIGGIVLVGLFLWVEHRRGERAMMPLGLFGSAAFGGLTLTTFLLYAALSGLILLLPYVLIVGGGYSPLKAGAALLPFSIVLGGGSRLMGRLAEKIGPRWPLTIGPIVAGAGFVLLVRVDPRASYWTSVLPGMAVLALGLVGAVAPLTTAVLASVSDKYTGTASGFNSAIARTGGLIATALAGAVMAQTGDTLISAFHGATLIGAGLAVAAGVTAFATLPATLQK